MRSTHSRGTHSISHAAQPVGNEDGPLPPLAVSCRLLPPLAPTCLHLPHPRQARRCGSSDASTTTASGVRAIAPASASACVRLADRFATRRAGASQMPCRRSRATPSQRRCGSGRDLAVFARPDRQVPVRCATLPGGAGHGSPSWPRSVSTTAAAAVRSKAHGGMAAEMDDLLHGASPVVVNLCRDPSTIRDTVLHQASCVLVRASFEATRTAPPLAACACAEAEHQG